MTIRILVLRALALLFAVVCTAFPGAPKVPQELFLGDPGGTVDVIVQFKSTSGAESLHRLSTPPKHIFASFRTAALSLSRRDLALLASDPEVEYIAADHQ